MKKGLCAVLAIFTIFALTMVSCDTGGGGGKNWKVTFHANAPEDAEADVAGVPDDIAKQKDATAIGAKTNPTLTGYTFVGWFQNAAGTGTAWNLASDPVVADLDLYAKWNEGSGPPPPPDGTYRVTYDANGGEFKPGAVLYKDVTLPGPIGELADGMDILEEREGFVFLYWGDSAGATAAINTTTTRNANLTVYAIWELDEPPPEEGTIRITFNLNGGGALPAGTAQFFDIEEGAEIRSVYQTLPVPTRSGWNFVGWFYEAEGGTAVNTADSRDANTTLFAHWTQKVDDYDLFVETEGAEFASLSNASLALYYFELPEDAEWGDYEKITAEFQVGEATYTKQVRARLQGPYDPADFMFNAEFEVAYEPYNSSGTLADGNHFAPYILDNVVGGDTPIATISNDAGEYAWFTKTYDVTGTSKHSAYEAGPPETEETGPFIFGLGLTSAGATDVINQYIKNVQLIPFEAKADDVDVVIGLPLYVKGIAKSGTETGPYAAFGVYGAANNGIEVVYREPIDEEDGVYEAKEITIYQISAGTAIPKTDWETGEGGAVNMVGFNLTAIIASDGGTEADPETGKGNIEGLDFIQLATAPKGAVLRLYVKNNNSGDRSGWGVGTLAGIGFNGAGAPPNNYITRDIPVAELLDAAGDDNWLFLNIYNDNVIVRIELWEFAFELEFTPQALDFEEFDLTEDPTVLDDETGFLSGAFSIVDDNLDAILGAKEGSYLLFTVNAGETGGNPGWGMGQVGDEEDGNYLGLGWPNGVTDDDGRDPEVGWTIKMDLWALFSTMTGFDPIAEEADFTEAVADLEWIRVNCHNGLIIRSIELYALK